MPKQRFPKNIMQFAEWFPNEAACWNYLVEARWPAGFVCPKCGLPAYTFISTRNSFECQNGHQTSATAGTIMHRSKLPLLVWFWAAYLFATKTPGISATQLSRQLDIHYESAYMLLQKLRAATVNPERTKLSGYVEVDETTFGGKGKGGPGRSYEPDRSIIIVGVEARGTRIGRIRMRKIDDYKGRTLIKFIKDHIIKGSTIITDGFRGYNNVSESGYGHTVVSNRLHLVFAHLIISNLKAWLIGTHHGVSGKHLQAYLNEFIFRFNRRRTPMAAFQTLLGIGSQVEAPEYREIYHAGEPGGWKHVAGIKDVWKL